MTIEDVAMGFIRVANEAMCRPIRALTQVQFHYFPVMHPSDVINKTNSIISTMIQLKLTNA